MASPDFYVYAAQQRMAEIEAQRAQALADLAQYKATSDYQSAGQAVAQIANLDAERQNIASLHSRYVESEFAIGRLAADARIDQRRIVACQGSGQHGARLRIAA
jgi:lipopolysaccharide export system protein LptC